jgi:uncharacterized protein YcfJ
MRETIRLSSRKGAGDKAVERHANAKEAMMKRSNSIWISSCLALAMVPAVSAHAGNGTTWAKVVNARPVYETVRYPVDQEVCWDEEVWRRQPAARSATPVIVGSIIGGVIGNQFGGGNGKVALTAAGAVLGGSIGNDVSHRRNPDGYYVVTERRCTVETDWRTEQRIVAWDVTYKYRGDLYQTRLREQPGDRIRVRVQVDPLGY